jgi:hypothetical protein
MIFTIAQINDIISILRRHQLVFIAEQLGLNYLSQADKDLLLAAGVDLAKYTNSQGIIEHAFLFGLLSEALGDERSKDMTYDQFKKFLKSGNFIPLTEDEEFALEQLKNRAYTDLTSLGNRIATGTSNVIIRANQQQQNELQAIVKKKAINAVKQRQSATKLASELGHATEDWERDWLRIAAYIMHEAYNYGRAKSAFRKYGEDAEVWFTVLDNACESCRKLYLKDPDDPDSEPIVFKLKDVIANGNNIGRKVADWKPTIAPIHPYCFNSPATKIYTSKGWKNISEINIGDLVLTHKGRFRKVTNAITHPYSGEDVYHLYYKFPGKFKSKCRKVKYITGNHPILTKDGWKRVNELKIKDTIYIPSLKCKECGRFIPLGLNNVSLYKKQLCFDCVNRMSSIEQRKDDSFRSIVHNAVVAEMKERYKNMSLEERKAATQKARKRIKEFFGFDTFRFSEEDIVEHGGEIFEELRRIFNNHSGNYGLIGVRLHAIKRIEKKRGCNLLYNISVEEDESYIADGIVVHNCRCILNVKDPNTEWDSSTKAFTKVKKYQPKNKKLQGIKLNIKVSKG